MKGVKCTVMRGGTSRGLFFLEEDLPTNLEERYTFISKAFGSPDFTGMQLDGMGGTTANKNKLAIISRRKGEINTVNYDFGQVDIGTWIIDTNANCGNISSAVGPFAIENGLIDTIEEPITKVRIFNTNTQKYILSHVPVKNGQVNYEGDFYIAGISHPGSKIRLDFINPGGATTGKLLPTGNTIDIIKTDNYGKFEVSCVDAANPFVFVRASDVGMVGSELPTEISSKAQLLPKLLEIREVSAVLYGFAKSTKDARDNVHAVPKLCCIAPAQQYVAVDNSIVAKQDVDVLARMLSMNKPVPILAITGSICIGVAAKIEGTIVNEVLTSTAYTSEVLRIGHPSGILPVSASVKKEDDIYTAEFGTVYRTARKLMTGTVYAI